MKIDPQICEEARGKVAEGMEIRDMVRFLCAKGLTIVQSAWLLKELYNCSRADAKCAVVSHDIWAQIRAAAEPLHQAIEEDLKSISEDKG
jgi:HD superfamily phosphohydrolase YqeK